MLSKSIGAWLVVGLYMECIGYAELGDWLIIDDDDDDDDDDDVNPCLLCRHCAEGQKKFRIGPWPVHNMS